MTGGYASRPSSGHSTELRSSMSGSRSEELAIYKKASRTPQPSHSKQSGSSGVKDSVAAPNVSMGFEGEGSKTPGRGVKGGGTLSEQRKRIAQAVGRN